MSKPMTPFYFGQLSDEGLRVTLKGAFVHGQLVCASLDGVTWKRRPGESAEEMEKRVCADVRELLEANVPPAAHLTEAADVGNPTLATDLTEAFAK